MVQRRVSAIREEYLVALNCTSTAGAIAVGQEGLPGSVIIY